jgi:hypothetical protein
MYTNSGAKYENEAMEMDGFFHLPTFEAWDKQYQNVILNWFMGSHPSTPDI